jgi:hypothetical protein
MKQRVQRPLLELIRSQLEEIKKYKWIESEKAGRDIGWEQAVAGWMRHHFGDWKRHNWDRAIHEATFKQVSDLRHYSGWN